MGYIQPVVSEICDPQSLDPICGKFDKFLAHGQAHVGQMGKWPWQCTTRGLDKSGSRPPTRPDRDDNTPSARRAEE